MSEPSTKKITVCSSASFYTEVIALSNEIERLGGIEVILPKTAQQMKSEGHENVEVVIDWSTNPAGYGWKASLIRGHFDEIAQSDAVLVTNYTKHGQDNYIGPNVLMEMAVGFYLKKPLFVLNDRPDDSPLLDEIMGLQPIFLKGDVSKLKTHLDL